MPLLEMLSSVTYVKQILKYQILNTLRCIWDEGNLVLIKLITKIFVGQVRIWCQSSQRQTDVHLLNSILLQNTQSFLSHAECIITKLTLTQQCDPFSIVPHRAFQSVAHEAPSKRTTLVIYIKKSMPITMYIPYKTFLKYRCYFSYSKK